MKKSEIFLILATVIWGSSFPLMKISLSNIPPLTFLAYRFAIAIIPIGIIAGKKILSKNIFIYGTSIGIALFVGHALQIYGLEYTSPTNSAFITSLYIIFIPFLSRRFLNEKITLRNVISLFLAVGGLYLISGEIEGINIGDLLTLLCAIAFAFQIVFVQKYSSEEDYISLTFWEIFWVLVLSFSFSIPTEGFGNPKISDFAIIIYLGIFGSFVAFAIQMKYQKEMPTFRAGIIYTLEPVFGHIFSFIILGEILSVERYFGALLILSALWIDIIKKHR